MDIPFLIEFFVALELTVIEDLAAPIVQSSFVLDRFSCPINSTKESDKDHNEFLSLLHLFALPNPSSFFAEIDGNSFFRDKKRPRSDTPHLHEFVLTGAQGRHRYGACLMVPNTWVNMSTTSKVPTDIEESIEVPRNVHHQSTTRSITRNFRKSQSNSSLFGARKVTCFCLISRFPLLCTLRNCLSDLLSRILIIRQAPHVGVIESWAFSVLDIILPEPGSSLRLNLKCPALELNFYVPFVSLHCGDYTPLLLETQDLRPWMDADINHLCLFDSLSINNVFATLSALLFENRVLLLSESLTVLSHACETLRILMGPLSPPNVYVPVLPESLSDMLDAPTPFLMGGDSVWASRFLGIHRHSSPRSNFRDSAVVSSVENIHGLAGSFSNSSTNDIVVVNLDNDTLSNFNWTGQDIPWSSDLCLTLRNALDRVSANTADHCFDPKNTKENKFSSFVRVQQAFLQWNAMVIGDIESYITGDSHKFESSRWMLRFKDFPQRTQDWVQNLVNSGPFQTYIANHQDPFPQPSLSLKLKGFEIFRETFPVTPKWATSINPLTSTENQTLVWSLPECPSQVSSNVRKRHHTAIIDTKLLYEMIKHSHQRLESLYSTLVAQQEVESNQISLIYARIKWISGDLLQALHLFIKAGWQSIAESLIQSTNQDLLEDLMRNSGFLLLENHALIIRLIEQHITQIKYSQSVHLEHELISHSPSSQESVTSDSSIKLEEDDLTPGMHVENYISLSRLNFAGEASKELWPMISFTGTPSVAETLVAATSKPGHNITTVSLPSSVRNARLMGNDPQSSLDLKRGLGKIASSLYSMSTTSQEWPVHIINDMPDHLESDKKFIHMLSTTPDDQFVVTILSALIIEFKAHCRLEYGSRGHPKSFVMTEPQQFSRVTRSNTYKYIMNGIHFLSSSLVNWESINKLPSTFRMCVFVNLRNIFILQCMCQSYANPQNLQQKIMGSSYNVGGEIFGIERLNQCIITTPSIGIKHSTSDPLIMDNNSIEVKASPIIILAMADAHLGPQMRIWEPDFAALQFDELASEYIDRAFLLQPELPLNRGRYTVLVPRMGPGSIRRITSVKAAQELLLWIVTHVQETRLVHKLREKELIKPHSSEKGNPLNHGWRLSQKLTVILETEQQAKIGVRTTMESLSTTSNPSIVFPPNLSNSQLEYLRDLAIDWALSHGLCLRPAVMDNPNEQTIHHSAQHAPFALFPSPFPRNAFDHAQLLQPQFNLLVDLVSKDTSFLTEVMDSMGGVDPFTARLFSIFQDRIALGHPEPITLGIYRSDYLLHRSSTTATDLTIQQVELNTIACSFGSLSSLTSKLHKYLADKTGFYGSLGTTHESLPQNTSIARIANGIATAHTLYNVKDTIVVIIVQPGERNVFDQRRIEYELLKSHGVILIRATLAHMHEKAYCSNDRRLILDTEMGPKEVSVTYFRAGYAPSDYPTEIEWQARALIEKSLCVKCPTVAEQLAGTKKIQQVLAQPAQLQRYAHTIEPQTLRACFTGLYPLNASPEGDDAFQQALAHPERYVVKPQREGGGNNVYDADIPPFLRALNPNDRAAYILMDLIHTPSMHNVLVRHGQIVRNAQTVSELGIYGVYVSMNNVPIINEAAGHLLRTKIASSHEGGVAAGFAVLDSPYLV